MVSAVFLVIGAGAYQVGLMIMYVFSFSEYEAVRLASYERYTLTYLFGMMLFMMIFFVIDNSRREKSYIKQIIAFCKHNKTKSYNISEVLSLGKTLSGVKLESICKFLLYLLLTVGLLFSRGVGVGLNETVSGRLYYPHQFQERYTAVINRWKPYFEEANPYIIVQGDNGDVLNRLAYELIPYFGIANSGDFTIGFERQSTVDDIYTFVVTAEEWEKHVLNKDYMLLYMHTPDRKFIETYGRFFPDGVMYDMLYYVINDDGHLRLIPVE